MNRKIRFSYPRAGIALVLLAAWLTLSNHCGIAAGRFAAFGAGAEVVHDCCPAKGDSETSSPAPARGVCCKTVRALPENGAVKWTPALDGTPLSEVMWVALAVLEEPVIAQQVALDTGPPRVSSFAELVLQRSLRSHAPPLMG